MEASFSSLLKKADGGISYQNQEVRDGRKLVTGIDVVINFLLGILCLGCCETPMKILNRPLSI